MTRALWLDPGFGASGDMVLGALFALGADCDEVSRMLRGLNIEGWTVNSETTMRGGLSATYAKVRCEESEVSRHWSDIDALIAQADLPESARNGARSTFRRLAEVEAAQHGVAINEVHFHEVGAVDAIVDIVGSWIALTLLDIHHVSCGAVGLGTGSVNTAHGVLPVPAPATAALLVGAPVRGLDVAMETVTPTGAALLVTMANEWSRIPTGVLVAVGRGAGTRDPQSHPNVLSAMLVATEPTRSSGDGHDMPNSADGDDIGHDELAIVLETNVDDLSAEMLAHTIDVLLRSGASDAWVTPIVMKKGRSAHTLSVLALPERAAMLRSIVLTETGSLGIRQTTTTKRVLPREVITVDLDGVTVRVKIGPHGAKPEYDDLVVASARLGVPIRVVAERVRRQLD